MKHLLRNKICSKHFWLALAVGLLLGLSGSRAALADDPPPELNQHLYLPVIMLKASGTVTPPPPPPPTNDEARFFVEPEKMIGSAGLAIDPSGGMHLAYADWLPDAEQPKALYAYCPPGADCAGSQNWTHLALPTDLVDEVQLALTPAGRPRLLIRASSTTYTAIAPGKDFFYAACDQNCTNASGWTVTYLLSNHGTSNFDISDQITPQRYFALDPQGRPRFIYQDNNYFYQEPDHLGAYYVYCDHDCTDSSNWYETLITQRGQYDYELLKYPSLAFTSDGRPRLVAYLIPLGSEPDGIYYVACDAANCGDGANWQRVGLYARGNGTSASWDLALDSADRPRFAFYQGEGSTGAGWEKLHYIWCNANCLDSANWDNAEVGLPSQNGENPDLVIDGQDRPQIAYISRAAGVPAIPAVRPTAKPSSRSGNTRSSIRPPAWKLTILSPYPVIARMACGTASPRCWPWGRPNSPGWSTMLLTMGPAGTMIIRTTTSRRSSSPGKFGTRYGWCSPATLKTPPVSRRA